jgi:hypothetical protein
VLRSAQSTAYSFTQSTHATRSASVVTAPPHAVPPGIVTAGHWLGKPIVPGVSSPTPLHVLSAPPHALQIVATFLASALRMAAAALPSPGSGQGEVALLELTEFQHFASAFDFATKNVVVALPIAA